VGSHGAIRQQHTGPGSPEQGHWGGGRPVFAITRFAVLGASAAQSAAIRVIRWYQRAISAHNPPCCKYYPSCSNYALQAFERFGFVRGGTLSILRLLRCRPWSLGGIDDVPQRFSLFYRFSWSKAHEEPRLTPLASGEKETA
jgi:uncharacterized protein